MTQRQYQITECDSCGEAERRDQSTPFVPQAWRHLTIGYRNAEGGITAQDSALLCGDCVQKVQAVIKPVRELAV